MYYQFFYKVELGKKFYLVILLFIICFFSLDLLAQKIRRSEDNAPIKVINWWKYIDSRLIAKLGENGYKIDLSEYKSNEVALARLLSKNNNFDIAIVSNINLPLLLKAGVLNNKELKDTIRNRNYWEFLLSEAGCLPYLWGTTLYAYDSRTIHKAPRTLLDLLALKNLGLKIGIIDEPFELAGRIIGDSIDSCQKRNFKKILSMAKSCVHTSLEKNSLNFSPNDFITSYDDFLKNNDVATYGWQGSVFLNLKAAPWVKFEISESHPVLGVDYVCILKRQNENSKNIKRLKNFIEVLTSKESTRLNVESNQYFSPYKNDFLGLHPRVSELYSKLIKEVVSGSPIFIYPPNDDELKEINRWWKKVRYNRN